MKTQTLPQKLTYMNYISDMIYIVFELKL